MLVDMKARETPIEDYLCLALYTASRAVTATYRQLLADLELTYPQYLVMRLLWQRSSVPVKEFASVLALDYGTLSPLLKRLESRGLITRVRRSDDERSVEISLTKAGEAMRVDADRVPTDLTCAMGLDDQESAKLQSTLRRMTASLGDTSAGA
jgi:DNA-binding MarR family transcriptional regulator